MKTSKVELLAPAGSYESFIGAINAGADAVYVGGEKFSARAFAQNFDTDTLCSCIKYAHLFGKRVYLTLNTLIKESEFAELYDYVLPFYEAGLDGVIVQDLGVLRFLKAHFPHMELHASTQMAVTGPEFVKLCKELGVCRVVPARELSLKELKAIADAGIEVECFIHGAMCYCYSGMCLMSSILGGRSGNRGRCAQPCRLPYEVVADGTMHKDVYTLSLKDMCTISHIPALIEAGMSSFKIEGRMKRSEYAAGVTAMYRKYMDAYYKNPSAPLEISDEDRYLLEHLYIRSQLHDGYLNKQNGQEMVTRNAPSYGELEDAILAEIRQKYLDYTQKITISMYGYFEVGKAAELTVYTQDGVSVTVSGDVVSEANKIAASEDDVLKQLRKLGNTHFCLDETNVVMEGNAFLPNGMLNALRRMAIEHLERAIIASKFPELEKRMSNPSTDNDMPEIKIEEKIEKEKQNKTKTGQAFSILVSTKEQLDLLMQHPILERVDTLYLEENVISICLQAYPFLAKEGKLAYAMPYVLRKNHLEFQRDLLRTLSQNGIKKVLVRNVESLALAHLMKEELRLMVITDASIYCWNKEAICATMQYASMVTLPFELNAKEMRPLRSAYTEQVLYGYIPLMVTANCILKTNATCQKQKNATNNVALLKDRYGKVFTAITNCKYCYNTIYNSVPLSLHKKYNKSMPGSVRLQFSIENQGQTQQILDYYVKWLDGKEAIFPIDEYTTAHENRQVE